jgi:hypothetical protein
MRDLDTIHQQQNYCSTMRIKLGGQAKGVKPSVLGGRLLAAASQRSARDAFGS